MCTTSQSLNEYLGFSDEQLDRCKFRFSILDGDNRSKHGERVERPIDKYVKCKGSEEEDAVNKEWLFMRHKNKFFKKDEIAISLVHIRENKWLLTTVQIVTKVLEDVHNDVAFEGVNVKSVEHLFGCLIVSCDKDPRVRLCWYNRLKDKITECKKLNLKFTEDDLK